ncbi:MAG: hypothetical protein ABIK78_00780 [candidate division WOR-3 bacterium]
MARSKSKQKRMKHIRWLKYKKRREKKKESPKLLSQNITQTQGTEISGKNKE